MSKKVLFINPCIHKSFHGSQPHSGLACLSAILNRNGHEVRVLDYAGFNHLPSISDYIKNIFIPDVIGITCYSPTWSLVLNVIEEVKPYKIPIVLGGPHTACYQEDLTEFNEVDYIVIGEAEDVICNVVENARINEKVEVIKSTVPNVKNLPYPYLEAFVGHETINRYLLQTSRGCPFNCSFCAVEIVNSHKWRHRDIDDVINELKLAIQTYPKVEEIYIIDDLFSLNLKRAKKIIRRYMDLRYTQRLYVSCIRADCVDEEFIDMLKSVGTFSVGLGIESAHPQVFNAIGKKESLEIIDNMIAMLKRKNMYYACYMIIGLPFDTFERVETSINYIRKIKPLFTNWSMMLPIKGTRARAWFNQNGTVHHEEQPMTAADDDIIIEPAVETPEFTIEERKRAYMKARLATCCYNWRHPLLIIKRIPLIIQYGLFWDLISGIIWGFDIRLRRELKKIMLRILPFKHPNVV